MCGVGGSTIYVNGDDDPTRHLEMDVIYASPGVEVACATRKSISLFGMPRSIQGVTLVASEPITNAHLMAECGTSPQPGFLFDRHILEPLPRYRGHLAPPSLILFSRPSLLALYISALSFQLLYFSLEDMLGHKQSREGCNEYKYCRGLHTVLVGIPDLPDHPSHDEDNEIDGHTIH